MHKQRSNIGGRLEKSFHIKNTYVQVSGRIRARLWIAYHEYGFRKPKMCRSRMKHAIYDFEQKIIVEENGTIKLSVDFPLKAKMIAIY